MYSPDSGVACSIYWWVMMDCGWVSSRDAFDGATVAARMRDTPLLDPLFKGVLIREDGRVMLPLYLMRAKAAAEMQRANDRAVIVATVPPEQAYRSISEGGCPFLGSKAG